MKYVLMFGGTAEDQQAYENLSEAERNEGYRKMGQWFEEVGSRHVYGHHLQSPHMTTTVRVDAKHRPTITDGPVVEGNEGIGGFPVVQVEEPNKALGLVQTIP